MRLNQSLQRFQIMEFIKEPFLKHLIFLSIFLVPFVAMSSTGTTQNNLPDDVREMARKVMMPVVYKVPGMEKVRVVQNLKYTDTNDPNILMDVYVPPDVAKTEQQPVVIFIHGGAIPEYTHQDCGVYTSCVRPVDTYGFL